MQSKRKFELNMRLLLVFESIFGLLCGLFSLLVVVCDSCWISGYTIDQLRPCCKWMRHFAHVVSQNLKIVTRDFTREVTLLHDLWCVSLFGNSIRSSFRSFSRITQSFID
jgi:hypothetical protein